MVRDPVNNYRYTLQDRLGTNITRPLGENSFAIEWGRETGGKQYYTRELTGKIIFTGDSFQQLLKIERSIYRCDYVNITVERRCVSGAVESWIPWFSGRMSLNDAAFDADACTVTMKMDELKIYNCYDDNKGEQVNIFSIVPQRRTIKMFPGDVTLEKHSYTVTRSGSNCNPSEYWGGTGTGYDQQYVPYSHFYEPTGIGTCTTTTDWVREKIVVNCNSLPPGPDWILIVDTCASTSTRTYARPATVYNCQYNYGDTTDPTSPYSYNCQIVGDSATVGIISEVDNGFPMELLLQAFISKWCPGMTLKSDFFGVNPTISQGNVFYDTQAPGNTPHDISGTCSSEICTNFDILGFNTDVGIKAGMFFELGLATYYIKSCTYVSSSTKYSIVIDQGILSGYFANQNFKIYEGLSSNNYVTGAPSKVNFLTIFQKSDVKRANALNNASGIGDLGNMTFEKLMDALTEMFNLRWRIDGTTDFRIEHISWYSKTGGLNLTSDQYKKWVNKSNKWSYDTDDIPQKEVFSFMEAKGSDFVGLPIIYSGACVSSSSKDNTQDHSVDIFTTDVELCFSNPDSDSKVVDDKGFVMMAANYDGTNYYVITEQGILGASQKNNSLAWAQLHRDYYRYDRPLKTFTMNGQTTTALSIRPTKKQDQLSIPLCCGDTFDPDQYVITQLGAGVVDKAKFNFGTGMLDLDLLFAANDNLESNQPPAAGNDIVSIYQDTNIDIDVRLNDSDPDVDGEIIAMEIVLQPSHGVAAVTEDLKIRYIPNHGYVGTDMIVYRVYDNWHEPSNNALISITVRATNAPPIANDDSYTTNKNTVLTVQAGQGVFRNDSDDVSFTLQSYDATGTNGGTIAMNGNGSFTYTPPSGFAGIDTFTYTIVDDQSQTSTATVTVTVVDITLPRAVDVHISTGINTGYEGTGGAGGDLGRGAYLPSGYTFKVLATSGYVATTNGGQINVANDGHFFYNPGAGFTGTDTFNYSLVASDGTTILSSATIYFTVHVMIYVKLARINDTFKPRTAQCPTNTYGGYSRTATFRLSFFSNSAGTAPLDTTGMNARIFYDDVTTYNFPPTTGQDSFIGSVQVSGTTFDIHTNYEYEQYFVGCSGEALQNQTETLSLRAGTEYTVI